MGIDFELIQTCWLIRLLVNPEWGAEIFDRNF